MASSREKVLLAMSGGVDSSVAAALLLEQGYDVVGCFMRLGSPGESLEGPTPADACATAPKIGHQGCCSVGDAADARHVASMLGIPLYVCNFKRDFARVMDYFADEYAQGRTPNPCVRCNDWLKFGKLHDYAKQLGARFVASGHYARIDRSDPDRPQLLRGRDAEKDQSYVLFGARPDRLRDMLLPIGGFRKPDIREKARVLGLPVFDKPDSQEICFVPDNDYASLVESMRPGLARASEPGEIVHAQTGERIGAHAGHHHFTIGQRRGLGLSSPIPLYVLGKDPQSNVVTVGPRECLRTRSCVASELNWLVEPERFREPAPCLVQVRAHAAPARAMARIDFETDTLQVRFLDAVESVAPGQAAVCYGDGGRFPTALLLGGGWIREARHTDGTR